MQEYDVKRQLKSSITLETLRDALNEEFGKCDESDGHLFTAYGGITSLECWLSERKKVCVDTKSRSDVSNEEAAETIARYNRFLLRVTGYSSKERRKKAMKK